MHNRNHILPCVEHQLIENICTLHVISLLLEIIKIKSFRNENCSTFCENIKYTHQNYKDLIAAQRELKL